MEFLAELHPVLVHFPIAFLILYSIFETAGVIMDKKYLLKSALIILTLGVIASVEAALTGNKAAELLQVNGLLSAEIKELTEDHEYWATITLWFYFFVLAARTYLTVKKKFIGNIRYIFVVLSVIGVFFVFKTGEYGGKLVFDHGAGTKILQNIEK